MPFWSVLALYRLLLPLLFLVAFPGWLVKMLKRGGLHTQLLERIGIYTTSQEFEPCGASHIHAISVGETLLALKLIREWRKQDSAHHFVLATGTATGHHLAIAAGIPDLRITYSPLDFPSMVRRYLARFEPSQIILIEGEAWPHLLLICDKASIPVHLINARMSPRSARRFQKFARWIRPFYQTLAGVAIQEPEDASIWKTLGVQPSRIHCTGSLKLDSNSGTRPTRRPEFQTLIDSCGRNRPIVLAASTFPGEEVLIAAAIYQAAPDALPIIVPRHAERRNEVKTTLEAAGFQVVLRSDNIPPSPLGPVCLIIDSTGELSDWTAHADAVIIGKSFLATGGQNPAEAILAYKPLIIGPHMENFEPLASRLITSEACLLARNSTELTAAIITALDVQKSRRMLPRASGLLARHNGATLRLVTLLRSVENCSMDY